ncbi:MAG: glycyl-radical enzyme activating protein [Clostridia bacterium]|nr:glycyl-radical enzyme activating protein [Clostridia bacterium]
MTGRVFSIEEFSTFDGPGIRTTVFFKGCPLKCVWCHNPEGQSGGVEYMRSPNGCTGCGACLAAGAKRTGMPCLCEESVVACPNGLVRRVGIDYTPEELAKKLTKNARILQGSGGGITLSGGEPLMHADFICACAPLLGELSVALQTCGYADGEIFARVLEVCDFVLYDLKLADSAAHRKYCGVGNERILQNYRALAKSGKKFVTRIPLIPTVTDTEENLEALAQFISSCGVDYVEVLPYNKLTGSKYRSLRRRYEPNFDEARENNLGYEIFRRYGITAKKM